jgi:hypothetical protein
MERNAQAVGDGTLMEQNNNKQEERNEAVGEEEQDNLKTCEHKIQWVDTVVVRRVVKAGCILAITLPMKSAHHTSGSGSGGDGGGGGAGNKLNSGKSANATKHPPTNMNPSLVGGEDSSKERVCILYGEKYFPQHKRNV